MKTLVSTFRWPSQKSKCLEGCVAGIVADLRRSLPENSKPVQVPGNLNIARKPRASTASETNGHTNGHTTIGSLGPHNAKRKRSLDQIENDAQPEPKRGKMVKVNGPQDDDLVITDGPNDGAIVIDDD